MHDLESCEKSNDGERRLYLDNSIMADSKIVPVYSSTHSTNTNYLLLPPTRTPRDTKAAPVVSETKISGVPLIKEYVQTQNVPSTAQDIILASWKKSTLGKYNSILKRWADFCHQRGKEKFCKNADEIITFLTTMIENENIGYNTICGYRSGTKYSHFNTAISRHLRTSID